MSDTKTARFTVTAEDGVTVGTYTDEGKAQSACWDYAEKHREVRVDVHDQAGEQVCAATYGRRIACPEHGVASKVYTLAPLTDAQLKHHADVHCGHPLCDFGSIPHGVGTPWGVRREDGVWVGIVGPGGEASLELAQAWVRRYPSMAVERRPVEAPECPGHGPMTPRLAAGMTREQAFCGTWYDCTAKPRCGRSTLVPSPELRAQLDEQQAAQSTLSLTIDGDEVTLDGTTKVDPRVRELTAGAWKWSRTAGAWVLPRNLRPLTREGYIITLKKAAEQLGYTLEVEDTGVVQTEQERREAREDRLDARADRHEAAADRYASVVKGADATLAYYNEHMTGEPIKVGHHSEARHRRDIDRMDGALRRSVEAGLEATRRAGFAAGIRRHLESGDSPRTVKQRITRTAAELRKTERAIAAATEGSDYHDRMAREADRLREAIELDEAIVDQLVEEGKTYRWGPADFQVGDEAGYWGGWARVVRVNRTSVTVQSPAHSWAEKAPYDGMLGRKRGEDVLIEPSAAARRSSGE